jgi:hypothetical protein
MLNRLEAGDSDPYLSMDARSQQSGKTLDVLVVDALMPRWVRSHGGWSWRLVMEVGHGGWSWRFVMEVGHGGWSWRLVMEVEGQRRLVMEVEGQRRLKVKGG